MSAGIAHSSLSAAADFFPALGSALGQLASTTPTLAFLDRFKWTGLANLPPLWAVAAAGGFVLLLGGCCVFSLSGRLQTPADQPIGRMT